MQMGTVEVCHRSPSFSAEFATADLPGRVHEVHIKTNLGDHLIGHIATDSTMTEARERPVKIATPAAEPTKAVESAEPVETAELAAVSETAGPLQSATGSVAPPSGSTDSYGAKNVRVRGHAKV